jgi:dnd system-associated protein 4
MPQKIPFVRMPTEAAPLLRFVAASRGADREHGVFPLFADLFMAAAALGFARDVAKEKPAFITEEPRPIEYSVFMNQGYHEALLLIAISHTRIATVAEHLDQVAEIAESYAAAGLQIMADALDESGHPSLWIQAWQDILSTAAQPAR